MGRRGFSSGAAHFDGQPLALQNVESAFVSNIVS